MAVNPTKIDGSPMGGAAESDFQLVLLPLLLPLSSRCEVHAGCANVQSSHDT